MGEIFISQKIDFLMMNGFWDSRGFFVSHMPLVCNNGKLIYCYGLIVFLRTAAVLDVVMDEHATGGTQGFSIPQKARRYSIA
jgi:hypothetical protein